MQLKRMAVLLMAAAFLLVACGKKSPSYTRFIPKEASYVIALDVRSMIGKLEKDSLSVENMLTVLKDSSKSSEYTKAIEIWQQFKDAGVDFSNKILISVPALDPASGSVTVQLLAGLNDVQKLEAFIAKLPDAPKVQKEDGLSYATHHDMVVGWKNNAVMILAGQSNTRTNFSDSNSTAIAPVPGAGLLDKMKAYFELKKENSIASVKEFDEAVTKKADITVFANSGGLAGSTANPAMAMMPKVKELMDGIYSTTTLNFEDGKVVMEGDTYLNKKLGDLLQKYTGPVVDMSLIEPYASNNVNGLAAFSFKPEIISALLTETGFDALVNIALGQQGITMADITKAIKGDVAVIVSDFAMVEKTVDLGMGSDSKYTMQQPEYKLLISARLGDKAAVDKLLNLAVKEGMMIRNGNRLIPAMGGAADTSAKVTAGIEGDLLVVSTDAELYKSYVAKTGKIALSDELRGAVKGASMAFFVDGEKILKGIPETMFDSTEAHEKNILSKSRETFKTLWFNTQNFDGKKISGKGELTMAAGKNSLPQLVRFLMYVAEEMKLQDKEREVRWSADVELDEELIETAPAEQVK